LIQKIGVVSHDAGGAELICELIKNMKGNFIFSLKGPAVQIFRKNFGVVKNYDLSELITKSEWLICGTSWQSEHENRALYLAEKNSILAVSVLDHYTCYEERYIKDNYNTIPREIWVADEKSSVLAQNLAPNSKIKIVGNLYLENFRSKFISLNLRSLPDDNLVILYLMEPFSEQAKMQYADENYWKFTEFTAFEYFLNKISQITASKSAIIYVRKHPSETYGKYDHLIGKYKDYDIKISTEEDLLLDMARSNIIVGVDSIALLAAAAIEKPVYSSLPPNTVEPSLVTKKVTYLRDL
jgi:hypothetical protein